MKYYSETLKKFYDTEEALVSAETENKAKLAEQEKTKKDLAIAIEIAEKQLDAAYEEYNDAKDRASALYSEALKKGKEIIDEATNKVNSATKDVTDALAEFNRLYGTYTTTYTGDKAKKEYERLSKNLSTIFSTFNMFNW